MFTTVRRLAGHAVRSGSSLDDIAGPQAQPVRDAAAAALKTRLDAAEAAGATTQEKATAALARGQATIAKLMSTPGTMLPRPGHGPKQGASSPTPTPAPSAPAAPA